MPGLLTTRAVSGHCVHAVSADFVGDAGRLEFRHARSFPVARVAHERARTQGLRQQGGAHAAFAGAECEDGVGEVHGVRDQRTLRVTMVTTAKSTPTIQNRAVILDSGMFCFW